MACAWLTEALDTVPELPESLRGSVDERAWGQVTQLAQTGLQAPVTTSMGRLFDAVSALAGLRPVANYEGQAAIELEAACADGGGDGYDVAVTRGAETFVLDPRQTILAVLRDVRAGVPTGRIAARFHAAIANGTARACALAASMSGLDTVVLSGGVFANRRLLESVAGSLEQAGLRVLVPERLPPGDGGISFGQAAIAAARMRKDD